MKNFNIKKRYTLLAIGVLLGLGLQSCKKFVEVPLPVDRTLSSEVFADSVDASAAIVELYGSLIPSATSPGASDGLITIYTGLSGDELYSTTGIADEGAFYKNALTSNVVSLDSFWKLFYANIYRANAVIEGISSSNSINTPTKNQFIGEAKFIRAFMYFNLVNLYGGVPLAITTNYQINEFLPRASTDAVYQQIIADLSDAQGLLISNYPTDGRVRANKYTALALLARVYLYQKQWAKAESTASIIINNNSQYQLVADLNSVFLANSSEAIFQLLPSQSGYETAEGYAFVPRSSTTLPKYPISNSLLAAFETGDQREINWINSSNNTVNGITSTYYYPYKYKLRNDGNSTPVEDYMVFRLAEQYLIRAEARAKSGETNAVDDLNIIRSRAGLPNYAGATDQSSLLAAILHERQVELFCEWGHRWFDLKRTGNVNTVMSVVTPLKGGTWNSYQQLYPIWIADLQAAPSLTQTPGY